jgi:hypothetical protein
MRTYAGKYASILAHLSMSRHLKDKRSKELNEKDLEQLPSELKVVGRAILSGDKTNKEAAEYIDWVEAVLRSYKRKL